MMWLAEVTRDAGGNAVSLGIMHVQFKNQQELETDMREHGKNYTDGVEYTLYDPRPVCVYQTTKQRKLNVLPAFKAITTKNKTEEK
jgi:hypothetical protein